jgi:hypothetical protein
MNALEGAAVSGAAANGAASAQAAQPASDQATQITSLQGMGKEIAPRVVQLVKNATEKRDIAGFNAALNYATRALRSSPEVQLGTREGGSGVGITQKPGTGVAAAPATATSNAAAAGDIIPRDKMPAPKSKTTVTTIFARGGPAPAVVDMTPLLQFLSTRRDS